MTGGDEHDHWVGAVAEAWISVRSGRIDGRLHGVRAEGGEHPHHGYSQADEGECEGGDVLLFWIAPVEAISATAASAKGMRPQVCPR